MWWVIHDLKKRRGNAPISALSQSQYATVLMQAGVSNMGFLRDKWAEREILNLSEGEHDYFDRKSGKLFGNKAELYGTLAKALSAMANSGGGHIILGQEDDSSIEGVPQREGRTEIREWLEQKIPNLVSYPLVSFRVHAVIREAVGSAIPADKELIVIDVGDNRLAPHQAFFPPDKPQYYFRQGGKSIAAPHHYLEALRNRLTYPELAVSFSSLEVGEAHPKDDPRAIVPIGMVFAVQNVGRIGCNRWDIVPIIHDPTGGQARQAIVTYDEYIALPHPEVYLDSALLPMMRSRRTSGIGLKFFGFETLPDRLQRCLGSLEIEFCAVTDNHIGETKKQRLSEAKGFSDLRDKISKSLAKAGITM